MSNPGSYLGPGFVQTGPGSYELPSINVGAVNYEPQVFGSGGRDDSDFSHSHTGQLINVATRTYILNTFPPLSLLRMLRTRRRVLQQVFSLCPRLSHKAFTQ